MKRWLFMPLLLLAGCGGAEIEAPPEVPMPPRTIHAPAPRVRQVRAASLKETDEEKPENVPSGKTAYITIDDGPSETVTPRILDILQEHGVKATFFVLPHTGADALYERIRKEGHAVGNHSYTHDYKRLYAEDDGAFFREDIRRAEAFLEEKFGVRPKLFRFPGGSASWNANTIARRVEILEELGYRHFDWDASTGDTAPAPESRNPEVLTANVMAKTADRDKLIILMHDSPNKTPTAEALPEIIRRLKAEGYEFDTLENHEDARYKEAGARIHAPGLFVKI